MYKRQAQARYQSERAACINGASHQDRSTCLREAVERGVKDERRESAYTGKKNITVNVDSEERADFKAIAKRWRLSLSLIHI